MILVEAPAKDGREWCLGGGGRGVGVGKRKWRGYNKHENLRCSERRFRPYSKPRFPAPSSGGGCRKVVLAVWFPASDGQNRRAGTYAPNDFVTYYFVSAGKKRRFRLVMYGSVDVLVLRPAYCVTCHLVSTKNKAVSDKRCSVSTPWYYAQLTV